MPVTKAVIAVAGFGTRFLPASKVVPKELLPIIDKPIIQYLVQECVDSGITDIIFVTRPGSQGIADHFDTTRDVEEHLRENNKFEMLDTIRELPKMARFAVVRQARHLPYGNGTPLLAASSFIGRDEPFAFLFGDDMVLSNVPCLKQLIEVFERHKPAAVVGVQEVTLDEVERYGIVKLKPGTNPAEMERIVEKPLKHETPSRLAQFGRFVLTRRVIDLLDSEHLPAGSELYLTNALARLCKEDRVLVQAVDGTWLTTGDPLNFLKATVAYALRHKDIGPAFAEHLRNVVAKL